jgi:WD40 repeat protein
MGRMIQWSESGIRRPIKQLIKHFSFFFILILLLAPASTQAQDNAAPYLYYYDNYVHAVIVERADGTDSHLLGAGIIPEAPYITGPGWSPSGHWLAGTSRLWTVNTGITYLPWAVSADGQRRVSALDEYIPGELWWSPTADLLLAIGKIGAPFHDNAMGADVYAFRFALIDPERDAVLVSTEFHIPTIYASSSVTALWTPSDVRWTADGRYVIVKSKPRYNEPATYNVFDATLRTVSEQTGPAGFRQWLLPDGVVVYQDEGESSLRLKNLLTGQETVISDDVSGISSFGWSRDGAFGLLLADGGVYLLDVAQETLERVAPDWTDNESERNSDDPVTSHFWSPSGNTAVFIGADHTFYRLNPTNRTVTPVLENVYGWAWDGVRLAVASDFDPQTFAYKYSSFNPESGASTAKLPSRSPLRFSASGRYVAGADNHSPFFYNTETGMRTTVSPHGAVPLNADFSASAVWSADGDWFITVETPFVSMMGEDPQMSRVVQADGALRRDLSVCLVTCAAWLPPQIEVTNLPPAVEFVPGTPRPTALLEEQQNISSLSWSPDSKRLAVGLGVDAFYDWEWHIWDVAKRAVVQTVTRLDASDDQQRVIWKQDSQGGYIPTLDPLNGIRVGTIFGVSSDGQRLVAYPPVGDLSVLNAANGNTLFPIEDPLMLGPNQYAFSADGRLLAGTANQLRVELWDGETGKDLATLNIYGQAVAISQDYLAVGSSWNVQLFPIEDVLKATSIELPAGHE